MCIDFEKTFDSLEHSFLFETLKKFNFCNDFIKWIKTLYTNSSVCVKNNGYISDFFSPNRGVKQGCPISAILFILVTEILSIKIKQDRNIHGMKIKNTTGTLREVKLTQYADDTTFLLEDETNNTPLLKLLKTFSEVSRLKINIDKTECMGIGRLRDIKGDVHGIKINEKPIKYLGIYVGNDLEESMKLNWDDNIKKWRKL